MTSNDTGVVEPCGGVPAVHRKLTPVLLAVTVPSSFVGGLGGTPPAWSTIGVLTCLTPAESAKLVKTTTHIPVVAAVTHCVVTDLAEAPKESVFRFASITAEPVHREFTAAVSKADPDANAPQETTVNPVGAVPEDATDQ